MQINPKAFRYALQQIEDGFVFEEFSQNFLAAKLGSNFIPSGKILDRGIDGLQKIFHKIGKETIIYQMSINKDPKAKLYDTIEKLVNNKIDFQQLTFVTNQDLKDKDLEIETLVEKFGKPIQIWDINWFSANVNHSSGTVNSYWVFVDSYLHEFVKPGMDIKVTDLVGDPRLFVFLRQQWEAQHTQKNLADVVSETLIIYALEGTDPDSGVLRTKSDILRITEEKLKFSPKILHSNLDKKLYALSKKPNRKINHHPKEEAYCLPHETRMALAEKNLEDALINNLFKEESVEKLKTYLRCEDVKVMDCLPLIEETLHKIFYKQGIEFAELVNSNTYKDSFHSSLPDIISEVVDTSAVVINNRPSAKKALLMTIRDIIYNGSETQKRFLKHLSNTYMLLFSLQCDPKLATYFSTMASRLVLFVDNSIIIPAMSEAFLDSQNQRYYSLFIGAKRAGVQLKVNDTILQELEHHFKKIKTLYDEEYIGMEDVFDHESAIAVIPEIMMRAYFYAKMRNKVDNFNDFLDQYFNPNSIDFKQQLIDFLQEEFGIKYISNKSLKVTIDKAEHKQLTEALEVLKGNKNRARNDAELILTIYALREINNESSDAIYGFVSWWLSTDTLTGKIIKKTFNGKYPLSCYMRPDFLYNYISLSPSVESVDNAYKEIFPGLLGVNISHNIPSEVSDVLKKNLRDHGKAKKGRLKSAVREMADRLKSDSGTFSPAELQSFFDKEVGPHSQA